MIYAKVDGAGSIIKYPYNRMDLKKDNPIPEKFVAQDLSYGASFRVATKQLKLIHDGDIDLDETDLTNVSSGLSDYNSANNITPIFKRDTRQW